MCDLRAVRYGFTLIEVITVLSIIAILSTFAVPVFGKYIQGAQEKVCHFNCAKLEDHYETYIVIFGQEGYSRDDLLMIL